MQTRSIAIEQREKRLSQSTHQHCGHHRQRRQNRQNCFRRCCIRRVTLLKPMLGTFYTSLVIQSSLCALLDPRPSSPMWRNHDLLPGSMHHGRSSSVPNHRLQYRRRHCPRCVDDTKNLELQASAKRRTVAILLFGLRLIVCFMAVVQLMVFAFNVQAEDQAWSQTVSLIITL